MSSHNTNLSTFLENEEYSIEQHLKIILSVFTGSDLSVLKNKIFALSWMKQKLFDEKLSDDKKNLIYSVLKLCISNTIDVLLYPNISEPILTIILNCYQSSKEILDCFSEILKSSHFLKYFNYHFEKLADIIKLFVRKLNSTEVEIEYKFEAYKNIFNIISKVKNGILNKNSLATIFTDNLIETLSVIVNDIKKTNLEFDLHIVENIFYQVLFDDLEFRNTFLRNLFIDSVASDLDPEKCVKDIINKIKNFPTHFKTDILVTSYSLIFSGFLLSNSDIKSKFKMFIVLNSYIFISPLTLNERNKKCVVLNENIVTANALIELLLEFDLPLNSQMEEFTLMDWLTAFIDAILDKVKIDMNCSILKLLETCFRFSPVLIENCLRKFTKNVMLTKKKTSDLIKTYSDLCLFVLNVHVKLNRMHKLISALLITIKDSLMDFTLEDIPEKFDVLPGEIFERIQVAITNLPSTMQNVVLLNTLLYHLEKDCILSIEQQDSKQVDFRLLLMFDIVTYLISRFIRGTRVADHSVPDIVKDKFSSLMDNLAGLLGKFGKAVISKEHIPKLAECFLYICLVWGDIQLIFMVYEAAPRIIPKQVSVMAKSPTNLVYLHPYLSDYHWKLIAQRVVNFGDENCINLLNDLVLQKIHALPFLEDEILGPYVEDVYNDGPAVVCAHYLSTQSNVKWLFHHVSEFVHLLKPVDILILSKTLVNYCQSCDEEQLTEILFTDFREIRSLVTAMLCYTFHSLSKKLAKFNLKEMKKILRRVDYEEVLKAEINEENNSSVKIIESLLYDIGLVLSENFTYGEDEINENVFRIDLYILKNLPAQYLHRPNKSLMCLLTLSLIKNLIKLQFKNPDVTIILTESSKFLQGILTDVDIPESLDCGKTLAWFYRGLKDTPFCDLVMRRFCELKNCGSQIESVIDIVKATNSEEVNVFIKNKAEGIDLVTSYLINFEKIKKRKHSESGNEVKCKLMKLCYKNYNEVFRTVAENSKQYEKKLALYTLLLHEALKSDDKNRLELLCVHLLDFVQFAEENYSTKSEMVSKFLLVLLKYNNALKTLLPNNFLIDTWCSNCYTFNDDVIRAFIKVNTVEEYCEMMKILLVDTEGVLLEPESENLNNLCRLWKILIETSVKEDKARMKKKIIPRLCHLATKYVILANTDFQLTETSADVMKLFLNIFTTIVRNNKIILQYRVVDLCFDLISSLINVKFDEELLVKCVELLFVFCGVRTALLLDRIPSFYLCYKSLFTEIVRRSDINNSYDIHLMTSSAHKLEKLTDTFAKYKKDFTKTAISAIADCISISMNTNINESVKNHLKNIIYCWIGICDLHGLKYLSSTLSSTDCENLFKQYCANYNKYYKFTGKV